MNKIQTLIGTCKAFVDAMHYGFQWTEAQYITVEYSAIKEGDNVVASVNNISATPWLIGSITMRGNWMFVDKEITEAAQDHATKEFAKQGQVHPIIMGAVAPHISY